MAMTHFILGIACYTMGIVYYVAALVVLVKKNRQ